MLDVMKIKGNPVFDFDAGDGKVLVSSPYMGARLTIGVELSLTT
jgi:hypothetical protein